MTAVYLDYNASAPLRPEAKQAMVAALDVVGNPSSVHGFGRTARAIVETAREQVSASLGSTPAQVIFTSGASEANNWFATAGWDSVCLAPVEHDSVYVPVQRNVRCIQEISVCGDGVAKVSEIAEQILQAPGTDGRQAITLQMANNETGALQPVRDTAAFAREHGVFMHTDAVQAVGRVAVDFTALGVDAMSVSAHKFGGPKGVGALLLQDGVDLDPMISGGGQERRRRSGTENVVAIAGFAAAVNAAVRDLSKVSRLEALRDTLERGVLEATPHAVVLSQGTERLANTTSFAVPGKRAETMLIKLDLNGVAVSSGAACSSGKVGSSRTLRAMGLAPELEQSALRISVGHATKDDDVARFLDVWKTLHCSDKVAA